MSFRGMSRSTHRSEAEDRDRFLAKLEHDEDLSVATHRYLIWEELVTPKRSGVGLLSSPENGAPPPPDPEAVCGAASFRGMTHMKGT